MSKSHSVARRLNILSDESDTRYSICTLVNKLDLYQQMLDSFVAAGFSDAQCEYLFIDNSEGNSADAYQAINRFLAVASGRYIIMCHQDILLEYDRIDKLDACIERMNVLDPNWGLLGNAGAVDPGRLVTHVHDKNTARADAALAFPIRVHSLDENFIVIRREANLGASSDLRGFHLYGLDLCLQVEVRGYSAHVIDFYIRHTGEGVVDESFRECQVALVEKYTKAFAGRFLRTTRTTVYISGIFLVTRLFNARRVTRWVKRYYRKFPTFK